RSRDDLLHGRFAASQSARIVLGSKIANQRRDTQTIGTHSRERAFEQCRLACAGRRHEADHEHTRFLKTTAQHAREQVVVLEYVLPNLNHARPAAHVTNSSTSSISSATTSRSRP